MVALPIVRYLAVLAGLSIAVWAQDASVPGAAGTAPDTTGTVQPAAAPEAKLPLQYSPNPPVSGLDEPALEPAVAVRSFFLPSLQFGQTLDTNAVGSLGGTRLEGVSRFAVGLTLQRLWKNFDVAADYVGGVGVYSTGSGAKQIQALSGEQTALWRTGQFSVREVFSYLPEGSFGFGSYGGIGGFSLSGNGLAGGGFYGGGSNFLGAGALGSLGQVPRISSLVSADVVQTLSPRTSVTAVGSYALVHFTGNTTGYVDSNQYSGQFGGSHLLGPKDQIGVQYGYQHFEFPQGGAGSFDSQVFHLVYGHAITGRLSFVIAGGPQITILGGSSQSPSTRSISGSGRLSLRYRFEKVGLTASYDRLNTSGSGFFYGASTDLVRVGASRRLGRIWTAFGDAGYSYSRRLQFSIFGTNANSFQSGYIGGGLRRPIGRSFNVYGSYQFNGFAFDNTFCVGVPSCNRASFRNSFNVGLDWHARPIRLD